MATAATEDTEAEQPKATDEPVHIRVPMREVILKLLSQLIEEANRERGNL